MQAQFDAEISEKIAILAEKNKFKLKDEKYYKHSDEDFKPEKQEDDKKRSVFNPAMDDEEDEEDEKEMAFDPLDDEEMRQELLKGLEEDRERKRLEDEKLEAVTKRERNGNGRNQRMRRK